ncbi:MarR family winged helix-turn-helix transcriptional regulator [Limisalsivibrio acetivorans]|uniref:MarR family winged helix-turn-helix transcriptional regulator n=1 Tax=Limisalsivibrio acetivorans TaxID=1304888 RepID=UPI0003B2F29F|nr:MarR family transcriptional regulator [Limisalsivibrio acetivorans]
MKNRYPIPGREELNSLSRHIPDIETDSLNTLFDMVYTMENLSLHLEAFFHDYGLSPSRFTLLSTLSDSGGSMLPHEIATSMGLRKPTVTGLLMRLRREGYITSVPMKEDGRKKVVSLSEKGRETVNRILPEYYAYLGRVIGVQDKKTLRAMRIVLSGINARL